MFPDARLRPSSPACLSAAIGNFAGLIRVGTMVLMDLARAWTRRGGYLRHDRERSAQPPATAPRRSASAISPASTGTSAPQLYAQAIRRDEAVIAERRARRRDGAHTGRSPKDKAIVRDATTEDTVWWEGNNAMTAEHFKTLLADFIDHARGATLFAQDLYAGADPEARLRVRVFTEYAWHSLFIRDLLIRPQPEHSTRSSPT